LKLQLIGFAERVISDIKKTVLRGEIFEVRDSIGTKLLKQNIFKKIINKKGEQ
jgi:hypothetical protein